MKKIILLIAIVLCFSCENDEKCAICETTHYLNGDPQLALSGAKFIACDEELMFWQGRITRVVPDDNAGYTMISITRCK